MCTYVRHMYKHSQEVLNIMQLYVPESDLVEDGRLHMHEANDGIIIH